MMKSDEIYHSRVTPRTVRHAVRGVQYAVSEWGDSSRPLLVLLHGWGDTGSSFQFLVDALTRDWLVIAPDWRGFGETRCRAQSYWFPDYIADLDVLLDIYSAQQPVRLVGHSMGANVAGLYAGVFPERVEAFINIEGFGLTESEPLFIFNLRFRVKSPAWHFLRWSHVSRPRAKDLLICTNICCCIRTRVTG